MRLVRNAACACNAGCCRVLCELETRRADGIDKHVPRNIGACTSCFQDFCETCNGCT